MKLISLLAATALLAMLGSASAMSTRTNCPDQSASTSSSSSTTGVAAPQSQSTTSETGAQSVEKSAILPSAEQHDKSAAPTVQRDGQSTEARADCPEDANTPKPGGN